MEPDKVTESAQFASKLYQAVLSLSPLADAGTRQVHRMARALAVAEVMLARDRGTGVSSGQPAG